MLVMLQEVLMRVNMTAVVHLHASMEGDSMCMASYHGELVVRGH